MIKAHFVFGLIFCIQSLVAQDLKKGNFEQPFFLNLSRKEGLHCNAATKIEQDSNGFIWIGTNEGLNRYDGKNILRYTHNQEDTNSIQSNYVNDILIFNSKSFIVATIGGLDFYQNGKDEFQHLRKYFLGNYFKTLLKENDHQLWVGTMNRDNYSGGGLYLFDIQSNKSTYWKITDHINIKIKDTSVLYKYNSITCIKRDWNDKNILWIATEVGIVKFDIKLRKFLNYTIYNKIQLHKYQYITCILPDSDSTIWVGIWDGGLYHYYPKTNKWEYLEILNSVKDQFRIVTSLLKKNDNEILVGSTFGVHTIKIPNKNIDFWEHKIYESEGSTIGYLCWDIYKDKSNSIWMAMENGVSRLDSQHDIFTFFRLSPKQKLNPNICNIKGIAEGTISKKIFVSIDAQENLYIIDNQCKTFHTISYFNWKNRSENPRYFEAINNDSFGHIWLYSKNELFLLDEITNNITPLIEFNDGLKSLKTEEIFQILNQGKFHLWLIGRKKIAKLNLLTKETKIYKIEELDTVSSNNMIFEGIISNENQLVLATCNGILFHQNYNWHLIKPFRNHNEDLNCYYSITQTSDGYFWLVSSDQGLLKCKLINNQFVIENPKNGYPFQLKEKFFQVKSINDILWITTTSGIVAFDYQNQSQYYFSELHNLHFSKLPSSNNSQLFKTLSNGNIVFGTNNMRIGYFNPQNILKNISPKPSVFFDRFMVFDKLYIDRSKLNILQSISLSHKENFFSIYFGAIQFSNNQDIVYSYLLDGIDPEWVVTKNPVATYTNISGGKYTFRVKAKNRENIWSDEQSFEVRITPPFWKTPLFIIIMLFSLLISIFGFNHYRIKRINEKNKLQQLMLQSEVKALRVQMNPHFIYNALNSVKNKILSNNPLGAAEYLSEFAHLLRTILQQSRKKQISLKEELDTLLLYIQMEMSRFQHKFRLEYHISELVPLESTLVPPLIFQPYVENAIRHAFNTKKDDPTLKITVELEAENTILCVIDDNGNGRINNTTQNALHESLGMNITNERIILHNQLNDNNINIRIIDKINHENQPDGTRIEVRFYDQIQ